MKELRKLLFWASVGLLAMLLVFVFASCKSPQPTLSVNREVKDNTEEQVSKVSTDSHRINQQRCKTAIRQSKRFGD